MPAQLWDTRCVGPGYDGRPRRPGNRPDGVQHLAAPDRVGSGDHGLIVAVRARVVPDRVGETDHRGPELVARRPAAPTARRGLG
ncbi:hypothetical protein BL253_30305 [Pseudofrankia asymbiotica]|uniref:Uncharacterized protein n=1 Tax=Pseudofrankia asymbiotica TaxID=1834516 RepID=A0A1V2I4S3_9ACTN|nr:hypothetical protein BL253_30305 [Pseudofrankia asymbiotica]